MGKKEVEPFVKLADITPSSVVLGITSRGVGPRIGDFSGDSSVRGARIRGVLASQASAGAKGAVGSGS